MRSSTVSSLATSRKQLIPHAQSIGRCDHWGLKARTGSLRPPAGQPHHALFYTALYAGLRRSELLGLRWKDIDLDFATMSVVQALHQVPGAGYVFREPKTRRSKRLIDMPPHWQFN